MALRDFGSCRGRCCVSSGALLLDAVLAWGDDLATFVMLGCVRVAEGVVTVALFTPVTKTSSSSSVRSMTEPFGRVEGVATLAGVLAVAWLSVFVVSDVPWGGPGAVDPVAAGPEVTGEEVEDKAPATETDCVGALTVATDTPALGVVIPPAPPWYTARAREICEVGTT